MSARTVLVLPTWYPTAKQPLAGPFTRDHARAAAAYGHRMVVAVDEGAAVDVRALYELVGEHDGALRVFRFRYRRGAGRLVHLPALSGLARRLAREGMPIDMVHAHIHPMAVPAAIVSALLRVPFVVTENSSEWPRRTIPPASLRRARLALPRAALVCPVNERLLEAIEGYGIRARFRVVPNTVDTSVFHPQAQRSGPPTRLVNVAGHVEVKALDVLLRAFAVASSRRPELTLELIGEGPLTGDLQALAAELGLGERVHFAGTATPAQIAETLRRSHVFVLSSLSENMPLAVLEALCCGVPVAATDAGGIPEAVGEDGSLAPVGDPEALADAILRVVDQHDRFASADIGRRAAARWSFEAVGGTWDEIYRTLAPRQRPR
jgi:glycosyltransferase involved in cell wall biosynthesis